ncbi:alginate O-acetyltransferase AlgX-related protein [Deinococcus depolymerans]|uniref:AlgX/AlgJ SGNH hydrolase-like domain-containing protein n=1 Tax=Deinococcus depolymerans TaxID=392408 RepID=A0ABN1BTK2_9DEIO
MRKIFFVFAMAALSNGRLQASDVSICPQAQDQAIVSKSNKSIQPILNAGIGARMFYSWDLNPMPSTQTLTYFDPLKKALKSKGVELIIISLPQRSYLTPDMIPKEIALKYNFNAGTIASYDKYIAEINNLGIYSPNIVNLSKSSGISNQFFFLRDHHWTSIGADLVANNVANYIKSKNVLLRQENYSDKLKSLEISNYGSLEATYNEFCEPKLLPEKYLSYTIDAVEELISEDGPQVVIAGTSNNYRTLASDTVEQSFSALLSNKLKTNVLNVSISGGGASAALDSYLRSKSFQESPPKFIIWEYTPNGSPTEDQLLQIIPAAKGICKNPIVSTGNTLSLKDNSDGYFLIQTFDKNLEEVQLKFTKDGKSTNYSMKRDRRQSKNEIFYLMRRKLLDGAGTIEGDKKIIKSISYCAN